MCRTRYELAKELNTTEGEIKAAVEFGVGLDKGDEVHPGFRKEVLSGDIKVTKKEIAELRNLKGVFMARTKKAPATADAQQEIIVPESSVKQDGITLTVTVTEEEYKQILHICEVCGYASVDEWLAAAVHDAM